MSSKLFGAILLITSTTVGAGALALPVFCANYGFPIALVMCFVVWALLTYGSLLMVEINLWLPEQANLISMSKICLGRHAQWVTWLVYLILFYAILTTYFTALTDITIDLVQDYVGIILPRIFILSIYIAFLVLMIYSGIKILDRLNRVLVSGLFLSFLSIIIGVLPAIENSRLLQIDLTHRYGLLPIAVAAFGYQFIIPILRDFLDSDFQKLRKAIIWGSVIPLIIYLLWLYFLLSALPLPELNTILHLAQPSTAIAAILAFKTQHYWLDIAFRWFSYFAITTSMLGLTFSFMSFFKDGFHVQRWKSNQAMIIFIMFLPPVLYTLFLGKSYDASMRYGGLATLILYVVIPVLMIWQGRYRKNLAFGYRVKGGKTALIIILIFSAIIVTSGL